VPVVDLRIALGLEPAEYGKFTVIVVLAVGARVIGFIVDSVCDVMAVAPADIEAAPSLGASIDASRLAGIARAEDRFVLLLDIDQIAGHLVGGTT
jgi:purine-binding chemotaxis protein CheW